MVGLVDRRLLVSVGIKVLSCLATMVQRPLSKSLDAGGRIVLENVDAIRRLEIHVFAGKRQDGMHQRLVLDCDRHHHVLEGVLVLSLDGENGAQVFVVVLPEYHVLERLQPMEDWVHGDWWQTVRLQPFYAGQR